MSHYKLLVNLRGLLYFYPDSIPTLKDLLWWSYNLLTHLHFESQVIYGPPAKTGWSLVGLWRLPGSISCCTSIIFFRVPIWHCEPHSILYSPSSRSVVNQRHFKFSNFYPFLVLEKSVFDLAVRFQHFTYVKCHSSGLNMVWLRA